MTRFYTTLLCLFIAGGVSAQFMPLDVKADSIFTFKDSRDGKKYSAFTFHGVTWMGENLRYVTKESICYDVDNHACNNYGRLYTWTDAINACPNGWHLPKRAEWDSLIAWTGGEFRAGITLVEADSLGFNLEFGFPPNPHGRYNNNETQSSYWTSEEFNATSAYVYYFQKEKLPLTFNDYLVKHYHLMCRCVKDSEMAPADSSTSE